MSDMGERVTKLEAIIEPIPKGLSEIKEGVQEIKQDIAVIKAKGSFLHKGLPWFLLIFSVCGWAYQAVFDSKAKDLLHEYQIQELKNAPPSSHGKNGF